MLRYLRTVSVSGSAIQISMVLWALLIVLSERRLGCFGSRPSKDGRFISLSMTGALSKVMAVFKVIRFVFLLLIRSMLTSTMRQ